MTDFVEILLDTFNHETIEYNNGNKLLLYKRDILEVINYNLKKGNFYIYEIIEELVNDLINRKETEELNSLIELLEDNNLLDKKEEEII